MMLLRARQRGRGNRERGGKRVRGESKREREKKKFRDKEDDMLQVCYGGRGGAGPQIGRVCVRVSVREKTQTLDRCSGPRPRVRGYFCKRNFFYDVRPFVHF